MAASKPRILVVEDHPVMAREIKTRLSALGYDPVAETDQGEQALRLALELRPDLVLMDIGLTGAMDGIQTAQHIHKLCNIPVVFLTVSSENATLDRAKKADPFGYILKPFKDQELHAGLEIALFKHQTEQRLRASAEEHQAILQTTMDGYCLTDLERRFLEVNDACCSLTGYSREQLLTMTITDLDAEAPTSQTAAHLRIASLNSGRSRFECRLKRLDQKIIHVEMSVNHLPGAGGRLVCFLRDVSERKKLEEELHQSQKMEAVSQLAGGIAHDFNNILAIVMMHLSRLQANPAVDAEILRSLKDLEIQSKLASDLTRRLLLFSRRSQMQAKPLNLSELVVNQIHALQRLAGDKIRLCLDPQSRLPLVDADASMMEQVLLNLATNSCEAMPQGGNLTITTRGAELNAGHVKELPVRRTGQFVCVSISDTGTGMDEAVLKHLFEPYFTTKVAGHGPGLGLSIVYGIISQHQGWIEVESEKHKGSTFRVLLPAVALLRREMPLKT